MATKHFFYDQDKVKELRMKVINLSLDVLNDKESVKKWSTYKKELVMKIAPRVLPVLNAGRDDDKDLIPQPLLYALHHNQGHPETSETSPEN